VSQLWNGLLSLLGGILAFFYDVVPNYGVAIILLTIVVNLLVFPLTLKQVRSTRAMQELQPEMERIRREYKGDQEAMNQGVMELYRERGVSPFGCFMPLLVQMPIWFALFRVLRDPANSLPEGSRLLEQASEGTLRFLTMDLDLAPSEVVGTAGLFSTTAVPYLLLVGTVVATGFLQQKLLSPPGNPQSSSPQAETMQRVTKILPLVFGAISYVWPSGLNLYFATSNLFRTSQQLLIFKIDGRPGNPTGGKPAPQPPDDGKKPSKPQGSRKKRSRRRRR
jgi:YidC/Oxa1 family membrane protein insertase